MNIENSKTLTQRYPKMFVGRSGQPIEIYPFECGDGWFNLIDSLCRQIQEVVDLDKTPQVIAQQVKEKFGTLRFYTNTISDEISLMVEDAEDLSATICDVCGNPGETKPNFRGSWLMTRCEEHRT